MNRRLNNGLEINGYESKNGRVLASVCKEQIFIIPTFGIMACSFGYRYKYRIAFAFGIWLLSIGIYDYCGVRMTYRIRRAAWKWTHRKERDCRQKRRRIEREVKQ